MLTALNEPVERVTTAHRAKLAYIYVRQSSAGQVRSTRRAQSCNTGWLTGPPGSAGRASGSR